jgi:hypothetical protein
MDRNLVTVVAAREEASRGNGTQFQHIPIELSTTVSSFTFCLQSSRYSLDHLKAVGIIACLGDDIQSFPAQPGAR